MFNVNSAIGTCLGDYRLIGTFTANTSNFLFLAEKDAQPDHVFLVKRRHDLELDTQEQREAFLQRASRLKAFHHPYVLPLLDAGIDQSHPYSVTDYEKHGSLYDRMQKQLVHMLPLQETHALLARLGNALHTAHQEELIHGNLKPQNILFNEQNAAILADFSLFPSSLKHISTTQHIAVVTLGYGVSEPYTNQENAGISKENDRYALGLIAYELFTGQRAFTMPSKSNAKRIYKVRRLIPPRQLNPGLASSVEQALLKALAKDPTQRYSDIPTFLAALGIAPDLATAPVPTSLPNEVAAQSTANQSTAIGMIQPEPLQKEPEKIIGAPLKQVNTRNVKGMLPPKTLPNHSTRVYKNLILIPAIIVLVPLLFDIISSVRSTTDSMYPLRSTIVIQSQPQSGMKLSKLPALITPTATNTPQNQVVPVPTTPPNSAPTSTAQPIPTVVPPPQPACSIAYKKISDSPGQFVATIAITNTGTRAIDGWSLSWRYANSQHLYSVWGSTYQQNGSQVTLQSLSWDKIIQPTQTANQIGISGTYPHSVNSNPSNFMLNGMQCG